MTDHRDEGHKTVWYNSRFYRTNLLWKGPSFLFRDVHLFDERVEVTQCQVFDLHVPKIEDLALIRSPDQTEAGIT